MNKSVQVNRLQRLADFLKTVPKEKFNYSTWVGVDWQGKQDLSCGTTACALGWAATMPEFRRLGLRFFKEDDNSLFTGFVGLKGAENLDRWNSPADASKKIFGLEIDEHDALFAGSPHDESKLDEIDMDETVTTAKQVAKRIEKFIKYLQA